MLVDKAALYLDKYENGNFLKFETLQKILIEVESHMKSGILTDEVVCKMKDAAELIKILNQDIYKEVILDIDKMQAIQKETLANSKEKYI